MKKIFFLLPVFILAGAFPDFRPCLKKYSFIENAVPVTENSSITFRNKNCLKYDPFTQMCLIKSSNKKIVNFATEPKLGWWIASIKRNEIYVGNFAKDSKLLTPAKMSVNTVKNSVITDMFCRAVGIGSQKGFFKGNIIKHFVKYGYWGDVGIEIDENMKITSFDPFYVKGLKLGQKIESINSKPANINSFTEYVLLAKRNDIVTMNIGGKVYKIKIRKKIYGFTPLVHFGIKVDKHLKMIKIPDKIKNRYYINENARIIAVNGKKVSSLSQLNSLLSTYKNVTISVMQQGIVLNIPLR